MTADLHALTGAYALDALPPEERAFFERHLAVCDSCRFEVDEFFETTARLGSAAGEPPPGALRERVLDEIDRTRQLPPLPALPAELPQGLARLRAALPAVAAVLAFAVVALGAALGVLDQRVDGLQTELAQLQQGERTERMAGVLAAADRQEVPLAAPVGADLRFLYSPSLDRGVLVAQGLQPLPDDRTYELWLYHDGSPVPSTLFSSAGGASAALVEGGVAGAEVVAVTVEPAGGRSAPTGELVGSAELASA